MTAPYIAETSLACDPNGLAGASGGSPRHPLPFRHHRKQPLLNMNMGSKEVHGKPLLDSKGAIRTVYAVSVKLPVTSICQERLRWAALVALTCSLRSPRLI